MNATDYLGILDASVLVNYELDDDTSINTFFLAVFRILDILAQILHAFSHTTWEFRHFFAYHVFSVFAHFGFS